MIVQTADEIVPILPKLALRFAPTSLELQPMPQSTLIEAVMQALAFALNADPSVLVFGEDVGVNGGVFCATAGLQRVDWLAAA